jgi:hypothetical protein
MIVRYYILGANTIKSRYTKHLSCCVCIKVIQIIFKTYFPWLYLTLSYGETKEKNKEKTKLVTKRNKPHLFYKRDTWLCFVFLKANNFELFKTVYTLYFVLFLLHSIYVLDVIFIPIDKDNSSTISLNIPSILSYSSQLYLIYKSLAILRPKKGTRRTLIISRGTPLTTIH